MWRFLLVGLAASVYGSSLRDGRVLYTDATRTFNNSYAVRKADPNGARLDNFGRSVAIVKGLAIVGSPEDDDNVLAKDAGAVFVYIEDDANSDWRLIRQIEDGEPGDYFGWSVALTTDNFAVVGACRGSLYGKFSGAAYSMFIERDPYGEQQTPTHIVPTERHGSAFFGFSVAVDEYNGKVKVIVGAYAHRGKGAAFIYTRNKDGSLQQNQILYGSDSVYGDKFGWSVSIFNGVVAVGAPLDNKQGSAYVFTEQSGVYAQTDKIAQTFVDDDENNPLYGDSFGMCVAVGRGIIAVSSPHNDVRATDAGAVYIYKGESDYTFSQTLFPPKSQQYNRFGWSLAYDKANDRLAVGSDFSKRSTAGQVYLYAMSSSVFYTLSDVIYPADDGSFVESSDANFGYAVSIYGDYLAVGAEMGTGETSLSGDVYFYKAQTEKEASTRKSGKLSSSGSTSTTETSTFSMVGVTLLIIVPLCAVVILYMWYRYKSEGDNEGFGTFVWDEIGDVWDRVTGKGEAETTLNFMEEDDSQHSSHPMMESRGSGSDGSGSREPKKSRSKLSGLTSGSSRSPYSSKSSRTGRSSNSAKRAAGYTSANMEEL